MLNAILFLFTRKVLAEIQVDLQAAGVTYLETIQLLLRVTIIRTRLVEFLHHHRTENLKIKINRPQKSSNESQEMILDYKQI